MPAGLVARACSVDGSANAPLTSLPVAVALGSAIESAAEPAVEMTLAVVDGVVVLREPGVNAPNVAGVPSVRRERRRDGAPAPPSACVAERISGAAAYFHTVAPRVVDVDRAVDGLADVRRGRACRSRRADDLRVRPRQRLVAVRRARPAW